MPRVLTQCCRGTAERTECCASVPGARPRAARMRACARGAGVRAAGTEALRGRGLGICRRCKRWQVSVRRSACRARVRARMRLSRCTPSRGPSTVRTAADSCACRVRARRLPARAGQYACLCPPARARARAASRPRRPTGAAALGTALLGPDAALAGIDGQPEVDWYRPESAVKEDFTSKYTGQEWKGPVWPSPEDEESISWKVFVAGTAGPLG